MSNAIRQFVIVDMRCASARVANQENAIVQTARMLVGDICVDAFNPSSKVGADKQIQNAIDAIGGDALAARFPYSVRDIICRSGLFETGKRVKHCRPHIGPLLAALNHTACSSVPERIALVMKMLMCTHRLKIGARRPLRKQAAIRLQYG